MRTFLAVLCIWLCASAFAESDKPAGVFKSADELVGGWYHRHEHDTWVQKGANRKTIDAVLQRIESAKGRRTNPALVDTIEKYGRGNWIYEWVHVGDEALKRARKLDRKKLSTDAFAAYQAAVAYYTIASWPHLGGEHANTALSKARTAYLAAGQLLTASVTHPQFKVGNKSSRGLLHIPNGVGPFPVLIYTYGSDVTKEDSLGLFVRELLPRGIALLTVDLTGVGEASHIPILDGSDQILAAAREFVATLDSIDQKKVFVAGASFGGNAAARYFLNDHAAAGVISMCGPLHRPFVAPAKVYDALPALTMDGVKARLGILGATSQEMADVTPGCH